MTTLQEIGEQDGWRCWLCDQTVDPQMPSSDDRGASIDSRITKTRAKKKKKKDRKNTNADWPERLAHIGCNTGKGAREPIVPWPENLFLIDPVAILPTTERLARKGGREIMTRCPTSDDADAAADWLIDRLTRLHPDLNVVCDIAEGGGQYIVTLKSSD